MSEFEKALWLSSEKWIDSFPTDLPKHNFSKKHNRIMHEMIYGNQEKVKHKLSKGTIKVLLIAAILLAFTTTVFAIPASREYVIIKFFNHSSYNVTNIDELDNVDSLEMDYIPDGFILTNEYSSINTYSVTYSNQQSYFSVDKHKLNTYVDFDTEKYNCEDITINGITGVFFNTD